jgi:hypothetical protein
MPFSRSIGATSHRQFCKHVSYGGVETQVIDGAATCHSRGARRARGV